jgi:hypothetical protein
MRRNMNDPDYCAKSIRELHAEIEQLRTKVGHLTKLFDDQYETPCEQIRHAELTAEVAAFLDRLADRIGVWTYECRAMARKLRGET